MSSPGPSHRLYPRQVYHAGRREIGRPRQQKCLRLDTVVLNVGDTECGLSVRLFGGDTLSDFSTCIAEVPRSLARVAWYCRLDKAHC